VKTRSLLTFVVQKTNVPERDTIYRA
jgi:hypothetical protein